MSRRFSCIFAVLVTFVLAPCFSGLSCAEPKYPFDPALVPPAPDYLLPESWAVLPEDPLLHSVDVFFVHSTTYGGENWNQSLEEAAADLNIRGVMISKAGAFSTSASLYAPYYRQANLAVLDTPEGSPARQSLDVAYSDVEAAFDVYMELWNKGRPFILAGHSQGSQHLLNLMKRRFDDSKLQKQLVAAYIIGWSVTKDDLARSPHLRMAATPDQTGGIISYNTEGPNPEYSIVKEGAVAVNPLTMSITEEPADARLNLGAVFFSEAGFQEIPHYTGGQTVDGAFVIPTPSNIDDLEIHSSGFYHPYDYAFFFRNIQRNVELRIRAYLEPRGIGGCQVACRFPGVKFLALFHPFPD